jgi:fido (protein-threonine AMPylation protein)
MRGAERAGYNVFHAMPFVLDRETVRFSVANILALHAKIGAGSMDGAGELRTKFAAPIGSRRLYKHPQAIASSLSDLVHSVDAAMPFESDERAIVIASAFFAEFLAIHPFRDGNGRVARLCISWLLKDRFVVPISLAACGHLDSRDTILQCLDAPECWDGRPSQLARFVLECAVDTAASVAFSADILV